MAKFSVLEGVGISERCGKQCGHERAWPLLIYRKMSEKCGIIVEKLHVGCLYCLSARWGGGGAVSEKCGKNSDVAKFSVLEDVEISKRCGKQCGHERT